ncbi:hypothetical protein [Streptomyces sp. NPDC059788]|uniref:hypothetical protein n=1 Tax=Streptomyces sp. NPDC059788 TaxID=3346948 RepID=UPI0036464B27
MTNRSVRPVEPLVQEIDEGLTGVLTDNVLASALREGSASLPNLRSLLSAEAFCLMTETAAYGLLAARYPNRPAADLWGSMVHLVAEARPVLTAAAISLGMTEADLMPRPPAHGVFPVCSAMSWMALHGSQASSALAVYAELTAYARQCALLAASLRDKGPAGSDEVLGYYADLDLQALATLAVDVADDGLRAGDDPQTALATATTLRSKLPEFWAGTAGA